MARRVLWIRVCLSVLLSESLLPIGSIVFSKSQHDFEDSSGVVHNRSRFFKNICLCSKNVENGSQIEFFFNLLEDLVINVFWIWSLMKVFIICCIPAQILHLRKTCFLRYGPKCWWPIRLQNFSINFFSRKIVKSGCGQFGDMNWKLALSQEGME